ncbi:MAG: protein-S-isoprenylcysteine O-methyltransferase Ste14 [Myxococcota bacterium]|jgi:protein-S-isoprenylcysteine O-methyltransferase Ste14
MTLCLGVLFAALRLGLKSRKQRLKKSRREPSMIRLHMKLAKPAVLFTVLGFVGGALSSSLVRGWSLFETFHAWVGLVVALLFIATALYGKRAERGDGDPGLHGLLGLLAMLGASLAAIAGFVLLP